MIEVQIEIYVYALFLMMLVSITAFTLTIHSLKNDEFYSETMSFYKAYFFIGLCGFIVVGIRDTIMEDIELIYPFIFYVSASLLLLLAVDEKNRRSISNVTIGTFALFVIIVFILVKDVFTQLVVHASFGLPMYAFLFFKVTQLAVKGRNIGYSIMATAFLITIVASVSQLYTLVFLRSLDFAYGLAIISSTSSFVLVGVGFLTSIMISEHNQLKILTLRDPLTGMYNRRGLDYLIQLIIPASKRYDKCISAITIDIDFFKKINDTYGHDGGDEVLKAFSQMILLCPRASDASCRLGGEEFIVVLPETDLEGALVIAERIRGMIEDMGVRHQDEVIKLTASFGVATHCKYIDIDRLLKSADKALYKAKEEGRNRVCYVNRDEEVLTSTYSESNSCSRPLV